MQNNVPPPLFAPAGGHADGSDDFDLNEIFAEYFINEFDDPMNAYTSSMANYGGTAVNPMANPMVNPMVANPMGMPPQGAAMPDQRNPAQGMSLPTGGIKTVFHTGAPMAVAPQVAQPPTKKPKPTETLPMQYQQQGLAAPTPLGGGQMQFAHPGMNIMANQQQTQQQAQQQQQQMQQQQVQQLHQGMQQAAAQGQGGRVSLPVGVGIRLGGVGGIAPAMAQSAPRAPGVQNQYTMWGPGNGVVSDQAVAERRQRNREHAKRSRVRKKFMLEALQEEVRDLQKLNQNLRMMVQQEIPEHAMKIIADCCTTNPLFADETEAIETATGKKSKDLVRSDFSLMNSLATGQQCFVLSDPKLPDNPIVFASPGFYKLTGYTSKEVLGRNCRFLQGPGTDTRAVDVIRKAVAAGSDATVCLLNYKADGTPFWNQFFIGALRDSDNCIVNYVGVQCEVEPESASAELEDKVNEVLPLMNKDDEDE